MNFLSLFGGPGSGRRKGMSRGGVTKFSKVQRKHYGALEDRLSSGSISTAEYRKAESGLSKAYSKSKKKPTVTKFKSLKKVPMSYARPNSTKAATKNKRWSNSFTVVSKSNWTGKKSKYVDPGLGIKGHRK